MYYIYIINIISRDSDHWSPWGSWSSCSHSCGGYKSRSRQCNRGDCATDKSGCVGKSSETEDCDHANKGHCSTNNNNNRNVSCRHLDHRIQPGRDVHTLHQGDIPTPLHPWQSPSVAHSDREHSLWWSLPWYFRQLPGAPAEWRWLEGFLLHSEEVQTGSLSVELS